MLFRISTFTRSTVIAVCLLGSAAQGKPAKSVIPNLKAFTNSSGTAKTYSTAGAIDLKGPFFQSLGTNGRSCVTCHDPSTGWSITPALARKFFAQTAGLHPMFRLNDGATSPDADVGTIDARRAAYAMLLKKGLIRVGMPVPAAAQFELIEIDDPYGYASENELSLFRRPLPSTNVNFLTTVMWDGRQSAPGLTLRDSLLNQANGATIGHAEGQSLTEKIKAAIVDFEMSLFTAQSFDAVAGNLSSRGAEGGPRHLAEIDHANPAPTPFSLFSAWENLTRRFFTAARASVGRGEVIFNTKTLIIPGTTRTTTCGACHNGPDVGNSTVGAMFNIGIADGSRRGPDMPLYTLRNITTGEVVTTTDPGRALVTGQWSDIGRFKVPSLRVLAARAPYFHDGSAATLSDVVKFYNGRFQIGLTDREKADLVAFLRSL